MIKLQSKTKPEVTEVHLEAVKEMIGTVMRVAKWPTPIIEPSDEAEDSIVVNGDFVVTLTFERAENNQIPASLLRNGHWWIQHYHVGAWTMQDSLHYEEPPEPTAISIGNFVESKEAALAIVTAELRKNVNDALMVQDMGGKA